MVETNRATYIPSYIHIKTMKNMDPTLNNSADKEINLPDDNDNLGDEFFEDEKARKPKGKKIRKMKSSYDR